MRTPAEGPLALQRVGAGVEAERDETLEVTADGDDSPAPAATAGRRRPAGTIGRPRR